MKKIQGIIPPMVTPLLDNEHIDYQGAKRIADNMIEGGVAGIFLLGSTGESHCLAMHMRFEFVEAMCKHIANRVPVLVGVTETSMEDSLCLANHAKKCGACAVVAAAPYYYPCNQKEHVQWYKDLADASPLPVFLYNMPSKVKTFLSVDTVRELSKHPNIIGVKDSSGNMTYFQNLLHYFKGTDFAVYVGPEEQTGCAVLLGADGGVNGGANMYPKLFVNMYKAAAEGDVKKVNELQYKIMHMATTLYGLDGSSDGGFMMGLKTALGVKGLCSGFVARPYKSFEGEKLAQIKAAVADLEAQKYE